jgi:hypothetical protein
MASDLAIVFGLTGSGNSAPDSSASNDRCGSRRLRRVNARQLALDETDLAEFAQPFENARQECPPRHGRHEVIGQAPSELLRDLESHGLRALRVVAAEVDVREAPSVSIRDLRA